MLHALTDLCCLGHVVDHLVALHKLHNVKEIKIPFLDKGDHLHRVATDEKHVLVPLTTLLLCKPVSQVRGGGETLNSSSSFTHLAAQLAGKEMRKPKEG